MISRFFLRLTVSSLFLPAVALSGPLEQAKVTKIINDVRLEKPGAGERKADLNDTVQGDIGLITGIKSRSELLFNDNTLTRVGPESYFSFKTGSRDMTLGRGTLLLQVPKGIGGAKIHTAAITAAITGTTIMMEYVPKQSIKVLVLEGSLRLSVNHTFGDSLLLQPGKMVIMKPDAKHIPDPVTVNLKKIVESSQLVNLYKKPGNDSAPLPSIGLIDQEIAKQDKGFDKQNLVATNLVILGKGTNVILGSDQLLQQLEKADNIAVINAPVPTATPVVAATPLPTPNPNPTPNGNPPPSGTPPPPPPSNYITNSTTTIATLGTGPTITTSGQTQNGAIFRDITTNGSPSAFLFGATSNFDNATNFDATYQQNFKPSAVFTFSSLQLGGGITFLTTAGAPTVALVGNGRITNSPNTTITLGGIRNLLLATQSGDITLDSGLTFTTPPGQKASLLELYARGGNLNFGSIASLTNSSLQFFAENNVVGGATGSITAAKLLATGLQSVQFDGAATLNNLFQLNGGSVELGGNVTSKSSFLYGSSATINGTLNGGTLTSNVTADFTLSNSATLNLTGDNSQVTSGNNITLDGTTIAKKLTLSAGGSITFNGPLTTTAPLSASSTSIVINGAINPQALNFQPAGTFLLSNTGSIATTADSTINAGGAVQLDGAINSPNANFKITGVGNGVVPAITINGNETAKSFDFENTGNFLLSATGVVTATGDSKINATTGAITLDGGLAAGNLNLTASGDIDVNQALTANHLSITGQTENIAATITAHDVDLNPTADLNLTVAGTFDLSGHLHVNAGGNIILDGASNTTTDVQLTVANAVTLNGAVTAGSNFTAQGASVAVNSAVSAQSMTFQAPTVSLANTGSLSASGNIQINNATSVALDGTVNAANNLSVTGSADVEIGATTQASNATIHSATLTTNGTFSATTINLLLSIGLNAGGAGSLISAQNLSITVPTPFTFNTADATVTHFATANLATLSISAQSITFDSNISLSNPTGDLAATSGNLDATGHQLSGFDKITVANGNVVADDISANKLTVNQSGTVNIANNLTLAQSLSSPGTVTVGNLLAAKSVSADTIVTNALHADTVTATTALTVNSADVSPFSGQTMSVTAPTLALLGGISFDGQSGSPSAAPGAASSLTISTGTFSIDLPFNLTGGDADPTRTDSGGNGGQLDVTSSDSITVNSPITATTGQNSASGVTGGNGGTVNLTAQNTVTVNNTIQVSSNDGIRRQSATGGNINVTSHATSGTAISVTSSAQLLALLNAAAPGTGGTIKFVAAGGTIDVNGGAMRADQGTIDIHNNGSSGVVNLTNATLNASTVKAGALGNNGTLNIGGGTISADTLIKLYANSSNGNVNFTQDVTLNGNSEKIIAGDSVTIFNGKIVTINGLAPADVYTNHANYTGWGGNASTTGTFAGQGANTHLSVSPPGF